MSEKPPLDPEEFLRGVMDAGRNIKFGRGVIGKTSYAVIALIGMWALILARVGTDLNQNLALLGGGSVITTVVVWWIRASQQFAEKNPAQAMLEGTELIEYRRVEAEIKGGATALPGSAAIPVIRKAD